MPVTTILALRWSTTNSEVTNVYAIHSSPAKFPSVPPSGLKCRDPSTCLLVNKEFKSLSAQQHIRRGKHNSRPNHRGTGTSWPLVIRQTTHLGMWHKRKAKLISVFETNQPKVESTLLKFLAFHSNFFPISDICHIAFSSFPVHWMVILFAVQTLCTESIPRVTPVVWDSQIPI